VSWFVGPALPGPTTPRSNRGSSGLGVVPRHQSYTYDANGNELSAGVRTFTYDLANRLKTTTSGTTTTTYSYNGDGVRLQASTGSAASAKTNFLWDVSHELPQLALERNGNNVLQRRYTYGIGRLRQANGTPSYYAHDALGSVAGLLSNSGGAQRSWTYEPYGSIYTSSGTSPANFLQFTGEYLDPTGLYNLRARQYDPGTGRFLRPDPLPEALDTPTGSQYAYVRNKPTTSIDPTGLTPQPTNEHAMTAYFAASPPTVVPARGRLIFFKIFDSGWRRFNFGVFHDLDFSPVGISGPFSVRFHGAVAAYETRAQNLFRWDLDFGFVWDTTFLREGYHLDITFQYYFGDPSDRNSKRRSFCLPSERQRCTWRFDIPARKKGQLDSLDNVYSFYSRAGEGFVNRTRSVVAVFGDEGGIGYYKGRPYADVSCKFYRPGLCGN
jgi:RHS repeat-associated protein